MGWYERNIGYSRESRNYYRRSVIREIREERRQKKKQVKYAGIFIGNLAFLLITLILWATSYMTAGVELNAKKFPLKRGVEFEVNRPGKIHELSLKLPYSTTLTKFERASGVLMDIYGPDGKRIYSFYKTLWWYREASDDQGASAPLEAKIILNESGTYKAYAYVVDDEFIKNSSGVDQKRERLLWGEMTVKSKSSGSLYYKYILYFEVGILILFLIMSNYLGSPLQMFNLIKADKSLLMNPLPLLYMGMIASFLILVLYWNYMGIGYAGYGDYLHSPNWFFNTNEVIYIG